MQIPKEAIPIVRQVLEEVGEVVGDIVMKVATQKHPELDERPVPDAGAEMDREREAALGRK